MGNGCTTSSATPSKTKESHKTDNILVSPQEKKSAPVTTPAVQKEITWKTLHSAARWNKLDDLKKVINERPDLINSKDDKNGNTAIHVSAQNGHFEIVKYLIDNKIGINEQNGKGNTALHMAVGYDYYRVAKLLIESGADQNIQNASNFTGLQGLDGDKSLPLIALISAEKSVDISELKSALQLCDANTSVLEKASFAGAGMRAKKTFGDKWTSDLQAQFKNILDKLD